MTRFELDKNSYSRYLGRNFKFVIELEHSAFYSTYCFINDTKEIEIEGKVYQPYPFDLVLPAQTETQGTQIVMSNIQNIAANEIGKTIYTNENIILRLYFVNIESEITEKYSAGIFELKYVTITPESITGTINIRHNLEINIGSIRYNRQLFPNLFL